MMEDPSRIFNCDETNLQLCTKTGHVISIKGFKNVYEIAPAQEKSTLTFCGTFSADGSIVSPTLIYPYKRIPSDIVDALPEGFHHLSTDSGWMTAEAFFNFVLNVFNKWLNQNKVKRPVIIFVDGHKAHITLQISVKCQEIGIILYLLLPNTTHFLQPADVGAYKSLKLNWKKAVHEYHHANPSLPLKRRDVAPLMEHVLSKLTQSVIKNGFRKCGLYPLNVDAVDFSKIPDVNILTEDTTDDQPSVAIPSAALPSAQNQPEHSFSPSEYQLALKILEDELGHDIVAANKIQRVSMPAFLYNIYKSIQSKAKSNSRYQNSNVQQPITINLNPESMVIIDQDVNIVTHNTSCNADPDNSEDIDDPPELPSYLDEPPTPPYRSDTDEDPNPPYRPDSPIKPFQIIANDFVEAVESNINKNDSSVIVKDNEPDNSELVLPYSRDKSCEVGLTESILIMDNSSAIDSQDNSESQNLLSNAEIITGSTVVEIHVSALVNESSVLEKDNSQYTNVPNNISTQNELSNNVANIKSNVNNSVTSILPEQNKSHNTATSTKALSQDLSSNKTIISELSSQDQSSNAEIISEPSSQDKSSNEAIPPKSTSQDLAFKKVIHGSTSSILDKNDNLVNVNAPINPPTLSKSRNEMNNNDRSQDQVELVTEVSTDEATKYITADESETSFNPHTDLSGTFTYRENETFSGLDPQLDESFVILENVDLPECLTKGHGPNEAIEIISIEASTSSSEPSTSSSKASTSSSEDITTNTSQPALKDNCVSLLSKKDKRVSYHNFASKDFIFKSPKVTLNKRKREPNKSYNITSKKFRKSIVVKDKDEDKDEDKDKDKDKKIKTRIKTRIKTKIKTRIKTGIKTKIKTKRKRIMTGLVCIAQDYGHTMMKTGKKQRGLIVINAI